MEKKLIIALLILIVLTSCIVGAIYITRNNKTSSNENKLSKISFDGIKIGDKIENKL